MTSVTTPLLITQCPGALIWWLEDDRALCRVVSPRLQDCGWRVVVFHRFVKLQGALQQEEPDLLLLELRIPGDLAVPSLRSWRRQGLACPVLILSCLADAVHRIDGLAAGANDYLAKPFHLAELTWRIEHLLVSSQPRRLSQHAMERPIPLGPLTWNRPEVACAAPMAKSSGLPGAIWRCCWLWLASPWLIIHAVRCCEPVGPWWMPLRVAALMCGCPACVVCCGRLQRVRWGLPLYAGGAIGWSCLHASRAGI